MKINEFFGITYKIVNVIYERKKKGYEDTILVSEDL